MRQDGTQTVTGETKKKKKEKLKEKQIMIECCNGKAKTLLSILPLSSESDVVDAGCTFLSQHLFMHFK